MDTPDCMMVGSDGPCHGYGQASDECERLRAENEALRDRLLHHYDALSDWPLTADNAKDMCRRIEELFPDLFNAALAGRRE